MRKFALAVLAILMLLGISAVPLAAGGLAPASLEVALLDSVEPVTGVAINLVATQVQSSFETCLLVDRLRTERAHYSAALVPADESAEDLAMRTGWRPKLE